MTALKEFAQFLTLNTAGLAQTHAQLLAQQNTNYQSIPEDSRIASARKLLKAVVEACQLQTFDPLTTLFNENVTDGPRRWTKDIVPPDPLAEVEALGQTLTPVVTNLEAGKFLWQMLADARAAVPQPIKDAPAPSPAPQTESVTKTAAIDPRQISQALRKQQEEHQIILNAVPAMIWYKDTENNILRLNKQAAESMGLPIEEVEGKSVYELNPAEAEAYHKDDLQVIESGQPKLGIVEPLITAQGKKRWLQTDKIPYRDEQGNINGVIVFALDITERKQLEEQVQESLERRARQVQTSTEVAQEIAAAPALDDLFRRVVTLVQERFGYYHAHVYTLTGDDLVMQEGTGQAGQKMKEAGHKIAFDAEKSLVARAARSGKPVLVPDVSKEPAWLPNPLLPQTKSELAVPIKLQDNVLGVLDVQSDAVQGLSPEDEILLTGLCGQIAVAINNRQIETERRQTQVVLRESEEKYKELVDSLPVGIYRSVAQSDGTFIEANPAIVTMFEAGSVEEFLKHKVSDLYQNPEDRETFRKRMLKFGFLKDEELRLKTLKGREIWGAVTAILRTDSDGQSYFEGIIEDITERKWIEKALRESEQKYRSILENIEDGYYEVDLAGNLTFFNDALCKVLGYPADELMGMNNQDFSDEENAQKVYRAFNRLYKTGQPVSGVEWQIIKKDGTKSYIETSASLIKNAAGEVIGFRGIARDITERKQAEEALRKSEERYRLLLESSPDPVALYNARGEATYVNPAFVQTFGWRENELQGQPLEFIPEENWLETQIGQKRVSEGEQVEVETRRRTKDGRVLDILLSASPHKDEAGNYAGMVAIFRDITERKQAEESLSKALSETQALYETSQAVTGATSTEEMLSGLLEALNNNGIAVGANSISFSLIETDEAGEPEWGELVAWWCKDEDGPPYPVGTRFYLKEMKTANTWIADPSTPVLISDGQSDEREDEAFVQETGIFARAILPLSVAGRWVGALSINWREPHYFTERDTRLYRVLMGQLASAVESQRLFEQAQQRAALLEKLSKIEVALSRAVTEEEILAALSPAVGDDHTASLRINYTDLDESGQPTGFYPVAIWQDGATQPNDPTLNQFHTLHSLPMADTLLESPDSPVFISNVQADPHVSQNIKTIATQLGFGAMVIMPLLSAGRWQGILSFIWPRPREFPSDERLIFQQLQEPVAAVVASRRAYLTQEESRTQSERRAQQEQTIREITEKMRSAVNLEQLVKITATELGQHLSAEYAMVDLGVDDTSSPSNQPNGNK